jgi:hypothetical protein
MEIKRIAVIHFFPASIPKSPRLSRFKKLKNSIKSAQTAMNAYLLQKLVTARRPLNPIAIRLRYKNSQGLDDNMSPPPKEFST